MYNKLFTKILDSSIWLEPTPIRIVWVTFIACMDQDGIVGLSSIGNVAGRARVTEEEAAQAISCLEGPDTRNPDQENEGRRIERVAGIGWFVINHKKFRDIVTAEMVRAANRERQQRHRQRLQNVTVTPVTNSHEKVTLSVSEAVSEETKKEQAPRAPTVRTAGERAPQDNRAVITKIAHQVVQRSAFTDIASLTELIKTQCARHHIVYDAAVVTEAIHRLQSCK